MSDLPQLHEHLVGAASRRARRRRLRGSLMSVAATAAVAGIGVTTFGGRQEPEVPVEPVSAADRLEDAYAVFRRPERAVDRYPGRLPGVPGQPLEMRRSRLIGQLGEVRYYLVEAGNSLCLMSATGKGPGGGGCGSVETYLDGKRPIGTHSDQKGPAGIVFAFPDGVDSVEVVTEDAAEKTVPVKDNAIAYEAPARVVTMRWTAPDGSPQKMEFGEAPGFRAADFWSVLEGAPPEGKVIAERDGVQAWLSQQDEGLCLRVRGLAGCRAKVADVRRAIIVIDRGLLAAAFPDGVESAELRYTDGTSRRVEIEDNAIPLMDADGLDSIGYVSPARDDVTDRIPAAADSAVLNADEDR